MKRWFVILLTALMLAGCAVNQPAEKSQTSSLPVQDMSAHETTVSMENAGIYDPDSLIEKQTRGAVRAFSLEQNAYTGIEIMGDNLLLFATDSSTYMTVFSGENLVPVASGRINADVQLEVPGIQIGDRGLSYYDRSSETVIFLDTNLNESGRIVMPTDIQGTPVLTRDWSTIYYYDGTALRAMDLRTGVPRLIREQWGENENLNRLCWNDQILECFYTDDTGTYVQYISVSNGETLYSGRGISLLDTGNGLYIAQDLQAYGSEYTFGTDFINRNLFHPADDTVFVECVLELGGVIGISMTDDGCQMDYYDLLTGKRTASVQLENICNPWIFAADVAKRELWFIDFNQATLKQTLYCWELDSSGVTDNADYISVYYTAESPDLDGLLHCKEKAKEIGREYGVQINIWDDALQVQPVDYVLESEYQVSAYEKALVELETALSRYPEGFFKKAAEFSDNGIINIGLVRSITGNPEEGSLAHTIGLQYWIGADPYISLCLDYGFEQTFYHEMCHVIDSYVNTKCSAYYDWEFLNPPDFEYDYDYIQNQCREDTQYLDPENRAFIDQYSMSYPTEDRARIMEYSMMEGCEYYFTTTVMQQKLRQLGLGIREAFDLEDYPSVLPWEQYLNEPLAPQ